VTREEILTLASEVHPLAVEVRRHLHAHPELSFEEKETSAYLAARLRALGLEPQVGVGGYGMKVVVEGAGSGPTVGLRADMDALPIQEETGLPFASQNPGVMHACGHDVHTATLFGAAAALARVRGRLHGRAVLLFQPGEEKDPGGASLMIRDGCLENPAIDAIFGLHILPSLDAGAMTFGAGPRMAAPDEFVVSILARGGHAARPELTPDPVLAAAQAIVALQQIVARNVAPFQQAVVTVGAIQGGAASNVIPNRVTFRGTVRTMSEQVRQLIPGRIEQIIRGVCEAAGTAYELRYSRGYPVLVNDGPMTELARRSAESVLGPERVGEMEPSMGGEDFAYFLQQVPGSFCRLGCSAPQNTERYGLHTSRLLVDESCMETGVAWYLALTRDFLRQQS
jgi:amidohydrolase